MKLEPYTPEELVHLDGEARSRREWERNHLNHEADDAKAERDEWKARAEKAEAERDEWKARAEKAEAERDEARAPSETKR